jgi:hypothetical protein
MNPESDMIDVAYSRLEALLKEVEEFGDTLCSETDSRVKIVDTMFLDVLGWRKEQLLTEEKSGPGFLDYKFSIDGFSRLIVEAKRDGRKFELSGRNSGGHYKLSGPVFKNADLHEGINQAILYSGYKGAELSCVTNGREWVVFRSNRLADGLDTLDGHAFVFPSLESVRDKFCLFYDLLGEAKVKNLVFRGLLQEAEGRIIRHRTFEKRIRPTESAHYIRQPEIVASLDRIMTSFFQRLTDEKDKEMLEKCFVETKESKAAEQRLLRLAEDLVGHIRPLDTGSGKQLVDIIKHSRSTGLNQFILLVGTKGAGKTTFIQRFFNLKLPPDLQEVCVPITVNLGESEGDEKQIHEWLRSQILQKIELSLQGKPPTWDEIIGHMFFSEYQRWSTGTMKHLYERDKQEFKVLFGKHIEEVRSTKPDEYIRGLLKNIVHGRKQLPCLIFDNADHFSIDFQEKVFQVARSLYEQEICVVIMPITDKTSWQLSRQSALQSFESEALLLPAPSARQVVEKRLKFVLAKLKEDAPKEKETYFFGKGIRVDFTNLIKFITALQEVLLNSDRTAKWLGALANHDVRRVLEISRDVINSPHLEFDDAIKAYIIGTSLFMPEYRIRKAIVRGRYDIFVGESHKYVHNIYDLNGEISTTPLLGIRILQAIKDSQIREGETKTTYVAKSSIFSYLSAMGIESRPVANWIDAMLKRGLIFNYDPTCVDEVDATQLEIAPTGELHLFWGTGNFDYILAMAEVTPILDPESFDEIQKPYEYGPTAYGHVISRFISYLLDEDSIFCRIPDHVSYEGQFALGRKLAASGRNAAKR